jgi:hypothetical protein
LLCKEDPSTVTVKAGVLDGSFDAASKLARFGDPSDEHCGMKSRDTLLVAALA